MYIPTLLTVLLGLLPSTTAHPVRACYKKGMTLAGLKPGWYNRTVDGAIEDFCSRDRLYSPHGKGIKVCYQFSRADAGELQSVDAEDPILKGDSFLGDSLLIEVLRNHWTPGYPFTREMCLKHLHRMVDACPKGGIGDRLNKEILHFRVDPEYGACPGKKNEEVFGEELPLSHGFNN